MSSINLRKAAIVGCGFVGASSAFALMQSGLFSEMVLIDSDCERAEGEALDIGHGMPLAWPMRIYAGDYDDASDAAMIIITAGANQKPGETRLDLVKKNVYILGSIMPEISKRDYQGVVLIVANPVDILTYSAVKLSGLPYTRVIGSGTVLDTARLKYLISEHLCIDSRSVSTYIIGEHGDSEFAAWSSTSIAGVPLTDYCESRGHHDHERAMKEIEESVRNSAYEIIKRKHATYYGIAMSVKAICEAIIRDEKSVLPVSSLMTSVYGIEDVALSMPAVVGKDGLEELVPIRLNSEEQSRLIASAEVLRNVIDNIGGYSA